ncbi:MAG: hypothetical protein OJF60_003291 [Burkholderiaceae bacterium]|nr:MAG: hypothetical protein OJF60_003291 [Burkholderiaceae bacterium]
MFYLAPTRTPQEFEALIEQTAKKDIDRTRFAVEQLTFASSDERSYPCVRTSYIVQDKAPQGMKNPLLLQTDALYCRHPKRPTTGFAISYSHRGESLDPSLGAEAQQFIAGAQVPE